MRTLACTTATLMVFATSLTPPVAAQERSGSQVVQMQCVKCHGSGVNGAPRIDDRAAWAPRMSNGVDATVRSAIRGHGAMPARGGMADLTDTELRAAILYMFYPAAASFKTLPLAATLPDPRHKQVGGVDFYLGIAPASQGKGYYTVNVTLRQAGSQAYIDDAQVRARAANAFSGGDTRKLNLTTYERTASYAAVFRMEGAEPYTIAVRAERPGGAPLEATFDFKP
jgi:cytochrome c5